MSKCHLDALSIFDQKLQDAGDIRVGKKSLFYLKNSKSEIFQKALSRVVLSSTNVL
jgi:hypothetical protein